MSGPGASGGAAALRTVAYGAFLRVFGVLPRRLRRWLVWAGSPHYTVGAICIVRRDDGDLLLVRHSYWGRWGSPGGLAGRNEPPELTAVRETKEEVGLDVEVVGEPVVVVEPRHRRVDVVHLVRPAPFSALEDVRPTSPEITATEWFAPGALPDLQDDTATALAALIRAGRLEPEVLQVRPSSARRTR